MTTPAMDLITELEARGVRLRVAEGRLRVLAPKNVFTDDLSSRLKAHRDEIIGVLLGREAESGDPAGQQPPITRADRGDRLPLSFAQERYWFLQLLSPESAEYNCLVRLPLDGPVDTDALAAALTGVVTRHEILRTRLIADADGEPYQVIDPPAPVRLELTDVSGGRDPGRAAFELVVEATRVPFDLAAEHPLRATLVRVAADRHFLVLRLHHVAFDEWSDRIIRREFFAAYQNLLDGREWEPVPLEIQYADFAVWQRRWLAGPVLDAQLDYWRTRLADPPTLSLPTDRPYPPVPSAEGASLGFAVPAEVTARLRELSRRHGATMFMTLIAAYAVFLSRQSGQDDLLIGTPIANRGRPETESLIGLFINTLAIRIRLGDDPDFDELLDRTRTTALEAYAHQDVPFEKLVDELVHERDGARTPLIQTLFSHYRDGTASDGPAPDLLEGIPVQWDLRLVLTETATAMRGMLEYRTAVFDAATVGRMAARFTTLLTAIVTEPDRPVSQLPLLTVDDTAQLTAWNDTTALPSAAATALDLIDGDSDEPALIFQDRTFTYRELHERSNRLAHHLRALGGGPETVIALPLERGFDLVVAILAIWKTGAAYLPLNPAHPEARNRQMATTSRALITITPEFLADPAIATRPATTPDVVIHPDQAAHVIYTSGSTGAPKGVVSTHRGLLNRLTWMVGEFPLAPGDRVLHKTPTTFDVSVWELIWPLISGATLVIAEPGRHADLDHLHDLLHTHRIGTAHFVPSLLHQFVNHPWPRPLPDLRDVFCSGEALAPADVTRLYELSPDVTVHNLYGPTEASIEVTRWTCPRGPITEVPIGHPISNVRIHLLDGHLRPVPPGVTGDLYIAGAGLARGYHNQPALTAERFVPGEDGERLYRTGDVARRDADGAIHYLGRTDHQVKLRGQRVEPAEIQHALTGHPAVTAAVVTVHRERLVAYVVAPDGMPAAGELRDHLRASLPEYMVPAVFVEVAGLPLNANGKLDRAALPVEDLNRPEPSGAYRAPSTPTEEILAAIWRDLLAVDRIGTGDGFFDLGGHSLLATRLVSRVRAVFEVDLPLVTLFNHPTIHGFGAAIDAGTTGPAVPPIVPAVRDRPLPLSYGQQRLWFLAQLEPESTEYHQMITFGGDGPIDVASLTAALEALVERHEVLRTRLVADGHGVPHQVVDPPGPFPLAETGLTGDLRELLAAEARRPFDLTTGPMLRGLLVRTGEDRCLLVLFLHHVVSDEWSERILRNELAALYEGRPLPELPVQYADYAVWQRGLDLGAQLEHWRTELADPPVLEFPADRPRPPIRSAAGATLSFAVPDRVADGLRTVAREHSATMFMTLIAGYAALLHRWTGQDDVLVGTPIAGRGRAEIEPLIGFFVNTLAIRSRLGDETSLSGLLDRVRGTALHAYTHQDLPFERLVDELVHDRDRSRTPLVQTLFTYAADGRHGDGRPVELAVPFDLALTVTDDGARLHGTFEYSTALFDSGTIAALAERLLLVLAAMVDDATVPVAEIPLLTAAERDSLPEWTGAGSLTPYIGGVDVLISSAAARNPEGPAVVTGDVVVSHADLDARANRLARHLRGLGVGPETVVGLHLNRGVDLVVAVLAVWKAGGAYVPLDPDYPADRIAHMRADSGATLVVDHEFLADPAIAGLPGTAPEPSTADDRLAAIIYTSGSTGLPKGALVTHRNLTSLYTAWAAAHFRDGDRHRWLSLTNISFDVFTGDLLRALGSGGTLHLGPIGLQTDTAAFADELARQRITAFEIAPRHADALTEHLRTTGETLPDLELLVVTTDTWHTAAAARTRQVLPHTRLLTAYGITETTIDSTFSVLEPAPAHHAATPIGRPLPGTRVHVLDDHLRPVPIGVTGEIYLGGTGVTRGFRGRPALTAERFVPDPAGGGRLYRTGDAARRRPDGQVEFLGRTDRQLKIRGFRIEPGEVQHALTGHPRITAAVVTARADRLVAHLVTDGGLPPVGEIRAHLRATLPEHMIPAHYVEVAAFPVTPNGKIDLAALPAPDGSRPGLTGDYRAPGSATEQIVAGVWAELLDVDRVGADDDFFELGGHSLLATQVIARLRALSGTGLPVAALFDHPTVAALAGVLGSAVGGPADSPIVAAGRERLLPLSFAQQRLWFLDRLTPGSAEYNSVVRIPLDGVVGAGAVAAALTGLVARHEALRTRLVTGADGEPYQVIDPPAPVRLPVVGTVDLAGLLRAEAGRPFDLAAGPLLRPVLVRLADDRHVLVIAVHHAVFDEWSERILRSELRTLYTGGSLPPLPIQYADYAAWQRGLDLGAQLGYWREQLADPPVLELPADRPYPPVRSTAGAEVAFSVPGDVAAGLGELSRQHGVTMFMTLISAYAVLLHRYNGQEDLLIGTPVANRGRSETEGLIGLFLNTLVLRLRLGGDPTFAEVLRQTRETALAGYAHQDLPFEQLVEELVHDRDRSRTPLIQTLFSYVTLDGATGEGEPGLRERDDVLAKFALSLGVGETGDGQLRGYLQYATTLFDAARIRRMAGHLLTLLAAIAHDAGRPLSALPLLTPPEQHHLLNWNNTAAPLSPAGGVHQMIRVRPDTVAVVAGGRSVSYAELEARANQFAHHLRALGAGAESVVALCFEQGPDMITAMLGVWKSGAAYLALDPAHPAARREQLVADSRAMLIVDTLEDPAIDARPTSRPEVSVRPDQAAYLMYTSGSTGRPKGVVTTHGALINYAAAIPARTGTGQPGDRYALVQPATTDAGNTTVLAALTTGGTLYLPDAGARTDPQRLAAFLDEHRIDHLKLTPSHLASMRPLPLPRRTLILGGEVIPGPLAEALHEAPITVVNQYGPTETTIGATVHAGPQPGNLIGRPIAGTRAHLLGPGLTPVPIGIDGEIHLGGTGVARGYFGQPVLTAERFVPDPFAADGSRLYRTGDLARWDDEGRLHYLGRTDDQIKIRGHRVEPAEVEAALTADDRIAAAVISAHEGRLVAHVVPADAGIGLPPVGELRERLATVLPGHLIPSLFITIPAIPATPGGKLDRAALPAPDTARPDLANRYVAPVSPAELALAEIWCEALSLDRVGATDDFFELGGHSLLATRVISRARTALGVDLPLAAIFDHPTIAGLAAAADRATGRSVGEPIGPADRSRPLELSFAQERLWFLAQLEPGSTEYLNPISIPLPEALDAATIAAALTELTARHEVLRTRLVPGPDGAPHQVVDEPRPFPLDVLGGPATPDEVAERIVRPFDLAAEHPVRGVLVRLGDRRQVLALCLHHVAYDEWSAAVLRRELHTLVTGGTLSPLPIQYADYAAWQRAWLTGDVLEAQLGYWRAQLADPPVLQLPADRTRPAIRSSAGATLHFGVPAEVTEGLRGLARRTGSTMFMVLEAAYAVLLHRYTGQDDLLVGVPIANRGQAETENLIGFLVNTLPLRTRLGDDPTVETLLARTRQTALDAYAHQDLPFERMVDELVRERDRSQTPLVQTLFNYAVADGAAPEPDRETAVLFDLALSMSDRGEVVDGVFEYSTALLERATVQVMAEHLSALLAAMTETPTAPVSALVHTAPVRAGDGGPAVDLPFTGVDALIGDAAARFAGDPAVEAGGTTLTYRELDAAADRLAHLLRAHGVGPETVVGLLLPRGVDVVTAVLAVWRAGGAYLPLDPDYPPGRLAQMLDDSAATLVLTSSGIDTEMVGRPVVVLGDHTGQPSGPPAASTVPGRAAAVIYTSGTTGRPKGTLVTHQNLLSLYAGWSHTHFQPGERHRWPSLTNISFDVFTGDLLRALGSGGTLVIGEPGLQTDVDAFARFLAATRVTAFESAPRYLDQLTEHLAAAGETLPDLRLLIATTDTWHTAAAARTRDVLPHTRLLTGFGITETSIDSTYAQLVPEMTGPAPTPIGRPLPGSRVHVTGRRLRPVPIGAAGDLLIAGTGVTRGYLGRPALTAERFVPDPFAADGSRLYRTGDLARHRADGNVEFLGRNDQQVKIRGYRVEPAEIEHVLTRHPAIDAAVVVARGERLVAYLVAPGGLPAADELRRGLRETLPDHMVPSVFVELAVLPLTPNGKIDRPALPDPATVRPDLAGGYRAPGTATEEIVAAVWGDLLGLDRIGADDDFFDLGGHSLLATRIVTRLRTAFAAELPLAAIFDHPTVAGLSAVLDDVDTRPALPPVTPADRSRRLPLSFAQRRLWFLAQLDPASVEYNITNTLMLGPVDVPALTAALGAITARHEVLRTRLVTGPDGIPHQVVDPPAEFPLERADVTGAGNPQDAAREVLDRAGRVPFDLAAGPLLRAILIQLADDRHVLGLCMHHVVSDEWSARIFERELVALYHGETLPELPVQYADYALWQHEHLTGPVLDAQLDHWRDRLADPPMLDLPTDRPRPPVRSTEGSVVDFTLSAEVSGGLRRLSREHGATMFMTLLAAYGVLLGRYSGQDDLLIGSPIANRNQDEVENLIGFFVNTLVLRADLGGDPTFTELLGRVRRTALDAYAHQDLPFERLVDELVEVRDRSRTPLVQTVFNFDTTGTAPEPGPERIHEPVPIAVKWDLTLTLVDTGTQLTGAVEYSTALYDHATVVRLIGHLRTLLAAIAATPDRPLSALPVLTAAERDALATWNDSATPQAPAPTVHDLFAHHARTTPDAVAVAPLTYAGLDAAANRLARHLLDSGIGAESIVGLELDRGPALITAILAVWKAGAAYLPLDPSYPADRLTYMRTDSRAALVIDDGYRPDLTGYDDTAPDVTVHPDQAAYLIYTSGSTGRPKGVVSTHRGLLNLATALRGIVPAGPGVVSLQFASASFDASVWETVMALAAGGTLAVATAAEQSDPHRLAALIRDSAVSIATLPPSLLAVLDPAAVPGLTTLVSAGERLDERLVPVWSAGRRLVNAYGPTEASVCASFAKVTGSGTPSIGGPVANAVLHVLDARLRPVPAGVPGELYLGGAGLARGYLGRPALTAASFVPDPFGAGGGRLYRTGDLVRRLPGGDLEYLGRTDHQIKVRGHRVEPAEIQAALTTHPGVSGAVIVADNDRLVAYLVPADLSLGVPAASELREHLRATLPEHLVPAVFAELTALPLSPNGKIDRAALPAPDGARPDGGEYRAPATPVERALAEIWSDLLGVDRIGVDDDFFDLGGHSLLATQVTSRIRGTLGAELELSVLFERPTIAGLAAAVGQTAGAVTAAITPVDRSGPLPLSFAQQRLWFLAQFDPESTEYVITTQVPFDGALDADRLRAALGTVAERHEALRTRLVGDAEGVPHQVVDPPSSPPMPVVDVSGDADPWRAARDLVSEGAAVPFDLAGGPLLRATLIRVAPDRHLLALAMHHIVCDEWSARLLRNELFRAYLDEPLPPLPVQYADYAVWQRELLDGPLRETQLAWWRDRLADPPVLELPTDRPRPPVRSTEGAVVTVDVGADVTAALRELSRRTGATMFMTLLAAYAVLLHRHTGQDDLLIGTPVANRNHAEIENLIGFFVNTLAIRGRFDGDPAFTELLDQVRAAALGAYDHQDLPFEELVDDLVVDRDRSRTPLVQTLFTHTVVDHERRSTPGGTGPDRVEVKFDLSLSIVEATDGLTCALDYSTTLFDEPTIRRMAEHLTTLLRAVVTDPAMPVSRLPMHDATGLTGPHVTPAARTI
ncbi:non-ribosomal peptide synthase/polyketide synthase, partial [Actinoplanes italicus]